MINAKRQQENLRVTDRSDLHDIPGRGQLERRQEKRFVSEHGMWYLRKAEPGR